jgi:hypothetical protein
MPERPKGAVCKIAGYAYGGSNPPPPTNHGVFSELGPLTSQNSTEEDLDRCSARSRTGSRGVRRRTEGRRCVADAPPARTVRSYVA